jgi:hypothetical protein
MSHLPLLVLLIGGSPWTGISLGLSLTEFSVVRGEKEREKALGELCNSVDVQRFVACHAPLKLIPQQGAALTTEP